MIKADMIFSVQENGSFHIINNGAKVGIIRKSAGSVGWHIDTAQNERHSSFDSSSDARKHASSNHSIF